MQGYNCILIFNAKADSVLFLRRLSDPYKGKLNLPGGKIEAFPSGREDGFTAAYRELEEETGITGSHVELTHMMDFTYYNQDCYVEVYTGTLKGEPELIPEKHPLVWLAVTEDFFDLDRFAGEGNIGHMLQQVKDYGPGVRQV